ncbi:MAG: hypothetical protein GY866_41535, partial [Proteobacteria bacterium]|nr:hypothetical protein [Pseudomonadota bacterium]
MTQSNDLSPFGTKLQQVADGIVKSSRNDTVVSSTFGTARSLLVSMLADRIDSPLLVVSDSYQSAEQVRQELEFFTAGSSINFFPNWDTIPYDNQSPDKDVSAVRFQTLANLLEGKAEITVTTPDALMQRILPAALFSRNCFELKVSDTYIRHDLLDRLIMMGFVRVDMVEEKGEFSVRGELIDLFLVSECGPLLLVFLGVYLEIIKFFVVETQRSTRQVEMINVFPAQEVVYTE